MEIFKINLLHEIPVENKKMLNILLYLGNILNKEMHIIQLPDIKNYKNQGLIDVIYTFLIDIRYINGPSQYNLREFDEAIKQILELQNDTKW